MAWTTTEFIASVRRRAGLPDASDPAMDADIMALGDDQTLNLIVPEILSLREEYYVVTYDTSIVGGTNTYRIPSRAVGAKLRDVTLLDAAGNAMPWGSRVTLEEVDAMSTTAVPAPGLAYGFAMQGDMVRLVPTPQATSGTLRMRYYRRPNTMVATTAGYQITSLSYGNGYYKLNGTVPSTWTTSNFVDVTQQNPNFDLLQADTAAASVTTGGSGFVGSASSWQSEIAAGDWVTLAGTTVVPHVPADARQTLEQATAVKVLEAIGDRQGAGIAEAKLQQSLLAMQRLFAPRVDGRPAKIVNPRGVLGGRRIWYPR